MIHLMTATLSGAPLVAICSDCDHDTATVWVRPANDPSAATLAQWMRIHRRTQPPHFLNGESNGT